MGDVARLDQRAYREGNAADRSTFAHAFRRGLESIGFVVLEGHGVDPGWIAEAHTAARRFFAQDDAAKRAVGGVPGGQRGYTGFAIEHAKDHSTPDLKEFFHVGREKGSGLPNVWPQDLAGFAPAMLRLYDALDACAGDLLGALALAYGVPEASFRELAREGNSILRALHYPPLAPGHPRDALRAAPHEDINLITLLCEATEPGLEVRTPAGWEPVVAAPGAIVVDAGDMLHQVTGGVIPSTTHRVVNPRSDSGAAERSRYALPFFAHPRPEVDLSVLPHFATPERVALHPPITAGDFLALRLREIGLTS